MKEDAPGALDGPRWLVIAEEPFLPADAGGRVETRNFLLAAHEAGIALRLLIPTKEHLDLDRYHALLPGASIVGLPRDSSPLAHLSRLPYVQSSRPVQPLERALAVTPPLVDAVISYSTRVAHMGETIAAAWAVPHMVRSYNIETEYFRVLAGRAGGPRAAAYRLEYMKFRRAETAMHRSPNVTVIADISREDHVWRSARSTVRTIHLPPFLPRADGNGADGAPARVAGRVLFAGSLDTPTNVEALRWFLGSVWPALLRLRPSVTLSIVGRRATPALLAELRGYERVTVEVDVPEVAPHLAAASVSINPMRSGSGINIKMIDAMSAGLPVVSTTMGARGMSWVADRDLLVADDPDGFARAVARLLDDPALAGQVARAGHDFVVRELDWATLIGQVRAALHGPEVVRPAALAPERSQAAPEPAHAASAEPEPARDTFPEPEAARAAPPEPETPIPADEPTDRVRGPFEPRTPVA